MAIIDHSPDHTKQISQVEGCLDLERMSGQDSPEDSRLNGKLQFVTVVSGFA